MQWVQGFHAVRALLEGSASPVCEVLLRRGRDDRRMEELLRCAARAGAPVRRVEKSELDRLSQGGRHQGVMASVRGDAEVHDENWLMERLAREPLPLLLVLDGVSDPHNLGACMRSAAAAGVTAVAAPRARAAALTPAVYKVSAGAAAKTPFVRLGNLARCLRNLRQGGVWVVGADAGARSSLYELDLDVPLALVLGAEERGLRRLTRECCDVLARLPMAAPAIPLNVSVAAGICLFEALRQRRGGGHGGPRGKT